MPSNGAPPVLERELAAIADLKPHPQNYRAHPADQRQHLLASIQEHGLYRNVVVTRDGTILAGHGVVEAAREAGVTEVPVVRLPYAADDPRAIRLLVGDNESARLAQVDDATLAALLKGISEEDISGLLGTGFDIAMLDALVTAAGPDLLDAWEGMPEFASSDLRPGFKASVYFLTEEDADDFFALIERPKTTRLWWPAHDGHRGNQSRRDEDARWVAVE